MKLRTKIFLLIGWLFLFSFVIAQVVEEFISAKIINQSESKIETKIREHNNNKRKAVESYLQDELRYAQAEVHALLDRIKQLSYWDNAFKPSEFNLQTNTWLSAATLLASNKNLDLIQNINNQKLSSLIILDQPPPYHSLEIPFIDEVKLIVIDPQVDGSKLQGPYIGIPFPFNSKTYAADHQIVSQSVQSDPSRTYYLLYAPQYIATFDEDLFNKRIERYQSVSLKNHMADTKLNYMQIQAMMNSIEEVSKSMAKAKKYLAQHSDILHKISDEKEGWFHQQFESHYDIVSGYNERYNIDRVMIDRYDQINMVWQLLAFNATGIFDFNPLSFAAPEGLCHFGKGCPMGRAILTSAVFFPQPVERLSQNVFMGDSERIFMGQTVSFDAGNDDSLDQGTLTVGIDIRNILKGLSVAVEENSLLVIGDRVVKAYSASGEEYQYKEGEYPIDQILKNPLGVFEDEKGKEYYFITLEPFKDSGFKLVMYNTRDKEFTLIDIASSSAARLNRNLSFQMSIIALLTLLVAMLFIHMISKKITTPIALLADSAKLVEEGELEKVDLPEPDPKDQDEIAHLYHSFLRMVVGLKEKEKVKGVLNKVVSPQIANKILDGNVELGGEEKEVSVLFADIRHFTEITEKLPPTDLIQILNHYMTIMSEIVDEHDGVIDKYVGDQVMALFGAPLSSAESAHRAVECGLEMIKRMGEYNQGRRKEGKICFDVGIGIHTGIVVAGNMGAENRMNYTVLGANVNLAARLCSAAQGMQLLVSRETLESHHVKENVSYEELKPIKLKGFSESVPIFELRNK